MPVVKAKAAVIVAGPNGAGKTTFIRQLRPEVPELLFFNADEIARDLPSDLAGASRDLAAGRAVLAALNDAVDRGESFIIETTLANRSIRRWISIWRLNGYRVTLIFLRLPSAEVAVERVQKRIALGGHAIRTVDIRRRFARGSANFALCCQLVDVWIDYASQEARFVELARGTNALP